eukprot:scaffold10610_cov124-Amphora_coffeaeformis.AAC.1
MMMMSVEEECPKDVERRLLFLRLPPPPVEEAAAVVVAEEKGKRGALIAQTDSEGIAVDVAGAVAVESHSDALAVPAAVEAVAAAGMSFLDRENNSYFYLFDCHYFHCLDTEEGAGEGVAW